MTKPIMLALSTFRQSEKAVGLAIEKAKESKRLVLVYVVDVNTARYLIGVDAGLYPQLKELCEEDLLKEHEKQARQNTDAIVKRASEQGIQVTIHVSIGRFALKCLEVVETEPPEVIITTRSKRPQWVKKFFGSPVDHLIATAGCPVIEV